MLSWDDRGFDDGHTWAAEGWDLRGAWARAHVRAEELELAGQAFLAYLDGFVAGALDETVDPGPDDAGPG